MNTERQRVASSRILKEDAPEEAEGFGDVEAAVGRGAVGEEELSGCELGHRACERSGLLSPDTCRCVGRRGRESWMDASERGSREQGEFEG